jgi:hypothetical protein
LKIGFLLTVEFFSGFRVYLTGGKGREQPLEAPWREGRQSVDSLLKILCAERAFHAFSSANDCTERPFLES